MSKDMEKPDLGWSVCVRNEDGTLVRVAEVEGEVTAQLLVRALAEAGRAAIHFKPTVEW